MTSLLELVVFLAPPLRPDADRPCAARLAGAAQRSGTHVTLGILAQADSETDLACGGQYIVHLACSRGLFWDVVHIDAGY